MLGRRAERPRPLVRRQRQTDCHGRGDARRRTQGRAFFSASGGALSGRAVRARSGCADDRDPRGNHQAHRRGACADRLRGTHRARYRLDRCLRPPA